MMYKKGCIMVIITIVLVVLYADILIIPIAAAEPDEIQLSFKVTDCSEDKSDGKIKVTIENYRKSDTYQVSFNAGKSYFKLKSDTITLTHAKNSFYTVTAMKNNDPDTVTDKYIIYVGDTDKKYSIRAKLKITDEYIYKDGKIRVSVENYSPDKKYIIFINGGKKTIPMKNDTIILTSLNDGNYTIQIKEVTERKQSSPQFTVRILPPETEQMKYIKAENILQKPELPTGCEITALTMLLNYIGFKADKEVLSDSYLEKGEYRAADPYKVFVGDPRSIYAYGCYSKVIVNAANAYLKDNDKDKKFKVYNITGCNFNNLCAAVDEGHPVIVWATMKMSSPKKGSSWIIPETGKKFTWTAGEHCLLMTGYDKEKRVVYMNDPLRGIVEYDLILFNNRFVQMGSHAVIIR